MQHRWIGYCKLLILSLFYPCHLLADDSIVPITATCDLSSVPSTTAKLYSDDLKKQQAKTLESIQKIVDTAVVQQKALGHRKRNKGNGGNHKARVQETASVATLIAQKQAQLEEVRAMVDRNFSDPELSGKQIALRFKSMPTKDVLIIVAKLAQIRLVVDADVTGVLSDVNLDNVPLVAALHSIITSNEPRLALIKDFGVWRVTKLQTAVELLARKVTQEREQSFATSVFAVQYAKWDASFKDRIEKLWQGITQASPDKQTMYMVLDEVNKKVFCRAHKDQVNEFFTCLRELDVKIPQIRIDARVISASKDFDESFGFNWSGVYDGRSSAKHFDFAGLGIATKPTGNASTAGTSFNDIIGWSLNFIPSATEKLIKIPFVFGRKRDLNSNRLTLELNAAEHRKEIKTIVKPSLFVHNQETAEILVGEEMPQQVRLDETVATQLTNVTTINYKDIGMKIKVKPVVAPDHESVLLDIYVERSQLKNTIVGAPIIGNAANTTFQYKIETVRSKNRVLLKSGQTTLIGGLIESSQEKEKTGIPYLQDIPILGWLFKGSSKVLKDKQILIFITPTLVES